MAVRNAIAMVAFAVCCCLCLNNAHGQETYYIDGNPLFLYKTINWWYDSLPEESGLLCGRPIKCINTGSARVDYDPGTKTIELKIEGGFAGLLMVLHPSGQGAGLDGLQCIWSNTVYFKNAVIAPTVSPEGSIQGFTIHSIEAEQARRLQGIERDIHVEVEGVIGGLANGRIALHDSGPLIKSCNAGTSESSRNYPFALKLRNAKTRETLAVFRLAGEP